jgi:cytochrome oxidase Cu insertion factor (SCO1/SenC/PrrC family)
MGIGRKLALLVAGVFIASGAALSIGLSSPDALAAGPPPASIGDQMDRAVQAVLLDALFTDQKGQPVRLRQFAGKAIFLVPFLTSCQEECPVTTGALLALEHELTARHLTSKAAIIEVTVDPGRDTPERMAAYAKLTGVTWPLLTASAATIAALWHYFGIYYQVVPEGSPAGIDWQSGQPYTYDVDHSDGFILLDPHLHERFVAAGMVSGATVPKSLRHLLDAQGVYDLEHPGGGSWTTAQAFDAILWALH